MTTPADQEAFAALWQQYYGPLYRFAYYRLNTDAAQAQDMVDETFVRAWAAWDRFDRNYPKNWLYRILRNLLLDYFRSAAYKYREPPSDHPETPPPDHRGPFAPDIFDGFEDRLVRWEALDGLTESQRQLLLLQAEGYDETEVADAIAEQEGRRLKLAAVKSRMFRARDALRQRYLEMSSGR